MKENLLYNNSNTPKVNYQFAVFRSLKLALPPSNHQQRRRLTGAANISSSLVLYDPPVL